MYEVLILLTVNFNNVYVMLKFAVMKFDIAYVTLKF